MGLIYYIGYYVEDKYENFFYSNIPGRLKMKYIYDRLIDCGYEVRLISLCHKEKPVRVVSNESIKYFISIPCKNKYIKALNLQLIKLQLFLAALFLMKSGSTIILYHSFIFTHFFNSIRRLKKFNIIIEVEEIYGFSATGHKVYLKKELEDIRSYDKAIFVNDFIPKELDFLRKSYVVSYGVCNIASPIIVDPYNDEKIHVIYAGTIEQKKLGAYSAVRAAAFLPEKYQVDIFGFGNYEALNRLIQIIHNVNEHCGYEKVRYMGYRKSTELSKIMTRYDIGLSTNVMEKDFANNTFPSKIITYMSHGLSIVSGYAEAFDGIELSKKWSFFYEYSPQAIADAICRFSKCTLEENYAVLKEIDDNLTFWLKNNI